MNNLIGNSTFESAWDLIGCMVTLFGSFIFFILISLFWVSIVFSIAKPPVRADLSPPLQETLKEIHQNTSYSYTKLTRIEKALGTDRRQNKK